MKIYPSVEEIKEKYQSFKTVPVSTEIEADVSALTVLKKLKNVSSHCYMLESNDDANNTGRYTFLGYDPKAEVSCTNYNVRFIDSFGVKNYTGDPRKYIKQMLDEHKAPKIENLPTFTGGLVGYFGYDYVKYSEPSLKLDAHDDGSFKDVDLMLFDKVIAFDNRENKIILIVNIQTQEVDENYAIALKELEIMKNIILNGDEAEIEKPKLKTEFKPLFDGERYAKMVEKAKHYIKEGDIFQVVLSNRLEAEMDGSLFGTYEILRKLNPSPYMFYFSSDDIEMAGASPETLVKLENGKLSTYPLAGTRPRGKSKTEDDELEKELLKDPKELAEHNMLVDLGRNDLGKISKFGTVKVDKYHQILKFSHVMHIGSTVTGEIREDKTALDAVDAVLPAGTLSGAPKIRAMQIINELENNKRGIYGGAVGYIDLTGNLDTCIAIRLAFKKHGKVYVRSGAGIVADSIPAKEHRECINKAKAVVTALKQSVDEIKSLAPSHIILSPGPKRPKDAGVCIDVVKRLGSEMKILGVCLGHQSICEAYGGVVGYAKNLMHGKQSRCEVDNTSKLFKGLPNTIDVARYHSLSVDEAALPDCLKITAKTDDGEIMAVEHKEYNVFGVQFHPESIMTPNGIDILRNFLEV